MNLKLKMIGKRIFKSHAFEGNKLTRKATIKVFIFPYLLPVKTSSIVPENLEAFNA